MKERHKAFGRSWKRLDEKRDLGPFVEEGRKAGKSGLKVERVGGKCWNRVLDGMGEKGPGT